jgi:hypothetical protein
MSEPPMSWVYAVLPDGAWKVAESELPLGVAGEPVRLVSQADLCAAVGSVSADEVSEETMRNHLADSAWVERAVRRHHAVVSALCQAAVAVPFRLGTVYHDDHRVREMLADRRRELVDALTLVAGRTEWGVQALIEGTPGPGAAGDTPARGEPDARPRPGTAYLLQRKAQRSAKDAARRSAADVAQHIHSELDRLAAATCQSPPKRMATGQRGQMVLNACYLVDDKRREEFVLATRELTGQLPTVRLRVTGPWPAYSFVELGGGEPR